MIRAVKSGLPRRWNVLLRGVEGRRGVLTRAYVEGPKEPPLLTQTVPQHFREVVGRCGDRNAVVSHHQNVALTYERLDRDSDALARGLAKQGVKKGDRVAVSLGNNVENATSTYALFKLGAILVPLNPAFNAAQVLSGLNHLEVSHLLIGTETNLPFKAPKSNRPLIEAIVPNLQASKLESEAVPSLQSITLIDNSSGRIDITSYKSTISYENVISEGRYGKELQDIHLDPNDIINIQFTSGTTSLPKAACLTHRSILNNGFSIGARMLLTSQDIVVCPPPLFHCFGCILGYMATATHGASIVFPSEAFHPLHALHAVQQYKATALYGVPTMFIAELDLLANGTVPHEGFQHLRTGIAAGSSIPAELMRKLHRTLNLTQLTICYGMTETSPVSAMTTTDDPLEKRIDTVGRLMPHVRAKVVDPGDSTRILKTDERGELLVSGYLTMRGYYGDPAKTAEVLRPDEHGALWMHTGDEASIDVDGYVKITGRIKDLIIRGGENIHPLEIENCIFGMERVREVSVVGVPDEKLGECVAAFMVRNEGGEVTAQEVRAWVKDRLSHHLVPKYVFWVDSFPKTPSGKIRKVELKEMAVALLKEGKGLD